jgi:hypothetical protein
LRSMRAIARSLLLIFAVVVFVRADAHDDVVEVFAKMADGLTSTNVPEFMSAFSKDMPDYNTLHEEVTALAKSSEISSSAVPLTEVAGDQTYKIELDWALEIRSLEQDGPVVRRREVIHCELRKEKNHWKIVSLKPLSFFAAANLSEK